MVKEKKVTYEVKYSSELREAEWVEKFQTQVSAILSAEKRVKDYPDIRAKVYKIVTNKVLLEDLKGENTEKKTNEKGGYDE